MRISDWSSDVCSSDLAGHDWPALIALAAATHRRRYGDMALALLTAETAALPSLLAPLRLDRAALPPRAIPLVRLSGRSPAGSWLDGPDPVTPGDEARASASLAAATSHRGQERKSGR